MNMALLGLLLGLLGGLAVWIGLRMDITPLKIFGVLVIGLAIVLQLRAPRSQEARASSGTQILQTAPASEASPTPSPVETKKKPSPSPSPSETTSETSSRQYTNREIRYAVNHQPKPSPSKTSPKPKPTTPSPSPTTPSPSPTETTPSPDPTET
jgi:hypothetical protein